MSDTQQQVAMQVYSPAMPVMSMAQALERRSMLADFIRSIMVEGTDYGPAFEGAEKPTLLMPGAEKLSTFFGLTPKMVLVESVLDWTGKDHDGEPFFSFWYKCELWRGDQLVAASDGSCNSWESKYRYRSAERACPNCGVEAIIKGKKEYGGGWLCWAKKGGCGAKWSDGAVEIEGQEVGKVLNPNPADLVNTVQKIAQKRAFVGTVKTGVNASEFFTQDIEDFVIDSEAAIVGTREPDRPEQREPMPRQERPVRQEKKAPIQQRPQSSLWRQDGPTKKRPPVKGGQWTSMATDLALRCPYYQNAEGQPDWFHILGAAGKLGWLEINDDNIELVIICLENYADEVEAEAERGEQLAAEAMADRDIPF